MFIELMIQSSNHTKVISKNTYHKLVENQRKYV